MNDLALSHFGFYVSDLPKMAAFYKDALLFTQTDEGNLGSVSLIFLSRDPTEHHQIALVNGKPENNPFNVINQISMRVPTLDALRKYHARAIAHGATDVQPVTHGNAISVYCRDPEGNRIEIFMDSPWYCDQPLREPIDFSKSDEEIMSQAEGIAKRHAKFMPRAQWQAEVAKRMAADQARVN